MSAERWWRRVRRAAASDRGLAWIGGLDAAVLVVAALAAFVYLWGPLTIRPLGVRISMRSEWRLLAEAVALALLRHALRPVPRLWSFDAVRAATSRVRARVPLPAGALAATLPIGITTRVAVLAAGYFAVLAFGYKDIDPPLRNSSDELMNLTYRWDTPWYIDIAANGYRPLDNPDAQQNLNFFPAFPITVRYAARLLGGPKATDLFITWVGTLLAIVAFLAALVYLYQLVARDHGPEVAGRAVSLLGGYPFALFFSVPYAESFFLLASVGAFAHMRNDEPWRAMAWGVVAGLCRPNGVVVSVALGVWAMQRAYAASRAGTSPWPALGRGALAAAGPIVGVLIYSGAVWQMTGDPFLWAHLQRQAWGRSFHTPSDIFGLPADFVRAYGVEGFIKRKPADAIHTVVALAGLAAIVPVTWRLGLPAGILQAGGTLLPLTNGGLTSFGRYSSVLFPGFIWLALVLPRAWQGPALVAFGMLQGVCAALFFTWRDLF